MSKQVTFNIKLNIDGRDVVVRASQDLAELRRAVKGVNDKADETRRALIQFGAISTIAQGASSAFSQIAASLNTLTQESRTFSAAMAEANTMAGKSGAAFEVLKGQVAELAKTIPVARDALARGLYQVISNAVPEDNWLTFLEQSARASVGGLADLGETVKVTSTIIKNYALSWQSAEEVQDKIQLTAKLGVTSFEQLAAALPSVAGQAAQLGVSFKEMLAVFATLTGATGNTNEVATQLASVLTALTKESSKAQKAAAAMGIEFNAASIKAAGGLHPFLQQLDRTVTAYSARTGQLRETIYSQLFGRAEAMRLLTALTGNFADRFAANIQALDQSAGTIDEAFDTMAKTGASRLQLLRNQLAGFSDSIASVAAPVMPMLNVLAQFGMSLSAVAQLSTAMRALAASTRLSTLTTRAATAAQALFGKTIRGVRAWVLTGSSANAVMGSSLTAEAGAATTAATATRAFGVAVRGLVAATGVGAAIWLLGEAFMALTKRADDSAGALNNAKQEADPAARAYATAHGQIEQYRSRLEALTVARERGEPQATGEKKIVEELNAAYGGTMGYFKNVASWYEALTRNSKAYCQQMVAEARTRRLADQMAELDAEAYSIRRDERGNTRRYSTQNTRREKWDVDRFGNRVFKGWEEVDGTSQLAEAQRAYNANRQRRAALERQLQASMKSVPELPMRGAFAMPEPRSGATARTTARATSAPKAAATKPAPARGSLDYYDERISHFRTIATSAPDEAAARDAALSMKTWQALRQQRAVRIGLEAPDDKEVQSLMDKVSESMGSALSKDGLVPLEFDAKTDRLDAATDSIRQMGSALAGLGSELELPALNFVGVLAQAVAEMALGYARATSKAAGLGPWGWVAFAATGLAQLTAMVASVKSMAGGFATGGIVGGQSYSGDRLTANVNSGEMVLTMRQQRRLFALANGSIVPRIYRPDAPATPAYTPPAAIAGSALQGGRVRFEIDGRRLVGVLANETRIAARSGRHTHIKI